jgi:hypothetical protein
MSPAVVRLEGAPFHLTDTPDADGDRFRIAEVEGWESMQAMVEMLEQHGDGSAFLKGKYPRRDVVVKGQAIAGDQGDFAQLRLRKKLENWAADWAWNQRWLYVDEPSPGISLQAKVRPDGPLSLPPTKGALQNFEIPFVCSDPRKYSQNQESVPVNGSETLINYGNFPTFVVATLGSTRTNPWIQNNSTGNQRITLAGSIPSGSTVDFLARRTIRAGVGMEEMAQRPRIWWFLLPGNNTVTTDGPWTVQWRHGYR